ncbi:response regulator receiver domain [Geobacter argillaceus]|nr:response regulator receiver domain [Geobacter argillaceus]
MNAVVVDNQPVLVKSPPKGTLTAKLAAAADEGIGESVAEEIVDNEHVAGGNEHDGENDPGAQKNEHELDVREVSDAFAEHEIACAFVFPDDSDTDEESKLKRIIAATTHADIVILDWYLKDEDPTLTMRVLKFTAGKDSLEKGRMRLICIYTGQPQIGEVTRDAITALKEGGLDFPDNKANIEKGIAKGEHHGLLVLNKQETTGSELPLKILEAFTEIADGLLPSFALAAVAAVRRNVHHIITRFSSNLDAAYVTNRLLTDPPSDVSELIRELFVSECDVALGLDKVADKYLEKDSVSLWLNANKQPIAQPAYSTNAIDGEFISGLLQSGIKEGKVKVGAVEKKFPEDKRVLLSHALHGTEHDAKVGECQFSRHITLKREAFGMSKLQSAEGWVPSLTLGTILRQKKTEGGNTTKRYYYCLTPACDTLRLNDEVRTFLVAEIEIAQGKTNLIIVEEGGTHTALHISPHPRNMRAFKFRGDKTTGRVLARSKASDDGNVTFFNFDSVDDTPEEFVWLGEVRRNRANRDMAELNREWLRFGIHDSELLRIAGRTTVKIFGN